jgi:hypothetical protein
VTHWSELVDAAPGLAHEGAGLLREFDIGLGFLATIRPDGGPRVHPICPLLLDELYGFIVPGPKLADLRRDPRYALHSKTFPPPRQDDAFYVTGEVQELHDADLRARLTEAFLAEHQLDEPWPGFQEQALVEFRIERVLLTLTESRNGIPSGHTVWTC